MESKISPAELLINLQNFTGTEHWNKFSPLYPKLLITDGVKYLADTAGCFWLLDILGSVQHKEKLKAEEFQVLKFSKKTMTVSIEDGNDNLLYSQKLEYTDFPLDEIVIWFSNYANEKVILLPSEY